MLGKIGWERGGKAMDGVIHVLFFVFFKVLEKMKRLEIGFKERYVWSIEVKDCFKKNSSLLFYLNL
jgi:hypothetical protein